MKGDGAAARSGGKDSASRLANRLLEVLVDAALVAQATMGRGILSAILDSGTLTWTFKPLRDCSDEIDDWPALRSLVDHYDPTREVVVVLVSDSTEFFCVSASGEERSA